ncbi:MAG TPA: iron-containing alcohol dehydrogenase [Treponemataceae bacterium]|jgi:alcohol dehydrogenase|nr:iron-containing alcohol dehydrogenase [Treponemataceae bacterium]HQL32699.1 iron-containing alcohol dehydrogenase [Treponemataceae bacterium]
MADFVFRISPNVILGPYTLARTGQIASAWGTNYMLIADPVLKEYKLIEKAVSSLEEKGISVFVFDEIPSAATSTTLEQALSLARGAHVHGVISFGGMKTASLGRAVAALYNEDHDIYEYLSGAQPYSGALPYIEIPSTGRDLCMFMDRTPVIDARNRQIKLMKTQSGICKAVIMDPNLYMYLSPNTATSMIFHAITLAVEGYVSTKSNFFSETILGKAIEMLLLALDPEQSKLVGTPSEMLVAQGGCLASMGVAVSSPGVASAISLACNARYKTSTSLVCAVLLPYIMEDASRARVDRIATIGKMLGVGSAGLSSSDCAKAAVDDIRRRLALAGIPTRLKDLSLSIDQLVPAAEDAAALDMMNYIPRAMSSDELFDLIKQAY